MGGWRDNARQEGGGEGKGRLREREMSWKRNGSSLVWP